MLPLYLLASLCTGVSALTISPNATSSGVIVPQNSTSTAFATKQPTQTLAAPISIVTIYRTLVQTETQYHDVCSCPIQPGSGSPSASVVPSNGMSSVVAGTGNIGTSGSNGQAGIQGGNGQVAPARPGQQGGPSVYQTVVTYLTTSTVYKTLAPSTLYTTITVAGQVIVKSQEVTSTVTEFITSTVTTTALVTASAGPTFKNSTSVTSDVSVSTTSAETSQTASILAPTSTMQTGGAGIDGIGRSTSSEITTIALSTSQPSASVSADESTSAEGVSTSTSETAVSTASSAFSSPSSTASEASSTLASSTFQLTLSASTTSAGETSSSLVQQTLTSSSSSSVETETTMAFSSSSSSSTIAMMTTSTAAAAACTPTGYMTALAIDGTFNVLPDKENLILDPDLGGDFILDPTTGLVSPRRDSSTCYGVISSGSIEKIACNVCNTFAPPFELPVICMVGTGGPTDYDVTMKQDNVLNVYNSGDKRILQSTNVSSSFFPITPVPVTFHANICN